MKTLNKLFLAIVVSVFLGVPAIAQDEARLYGLVTPFEERAERGEGEDVQSVLYRIDHETGVGTMIGGTGFTQCNGLDFEPVTNELFAVCRRIIDENENDASGEVSSRVDPGVVRDVLVLVDRTTGNAVEIGALNIEDADLRTVLTDISFSRDGMLKAYVSNRDNMSESESITNVTKNGVAGSDLLGFVDTATGQFTTNGRTGFSELFSGIAFSPGNILYHAGGDDINLVNVLDRHTGAAGLLAPLLYPEHIADLNNTITSMDTQSITGQLFAAIFSQEIISKSGLTRNEELGGFYLANIDPRSGKVSIIGPTVEGLAAIAFLHEERVVVVPTLSEWGLIALSGVLMLSGAFYLRRRASA